MNETLKIIRERFSCRDFTNQMPTDEQINAIAQAAIQAPSGMNRQHWQVIVLKNKQLIDELENEGLGILERSSPEAYQRILSRNGTLFYHAPRMIFIAVKDTQPPGAENVDLGIIAQNVVLAAESLGLASLHCGLAAYAFAGEKAEDFKKRLGFPQGYTCGIGVLIGYAKAKAEPHKPDQSKITIVE